VGKSWVIEKHPDIKYSECEDMVTDSVYIRKREKEEPVVIDENEPDLQEISRQLNGNSAQFLLSQPGA
jgi:hypothetical protein